jgi:hypothetical protein
MKDGQDRLAGSRRTSRAAALALTCSLLAACSGQHQKASAQGPVPHVVTGDIKDGIEKHIAEQVRLGNGFFKLPFEDKELRLALVRVHVEYLATLGPRRHFACVDMVNVDGEFYDVDFFLAGDPGSMTVTETLVHKLNGKPYYLWQQNPDKTWGRVPVEEASRQVLGVLGGRDAFEFRYQATLPKLGGKARAWLPIAQSDDYQKVSVKSMRVPGKRRTLTDAAYGNRVLYLELGAEDSGKTIDILYDVERLEKGAYAGDPGVAAKYLQAEKRVPSDDKIKAVAMKAVDGKQGDLMRARALYDRVLDDMRYRKCGDGWGQGDALYACNARSGNCTDFHAYFIALARSAGIPARFAIGAAVASERDEGGVDGYHCWAEFYADGKWWPVDISEADKFSALSAYYFGHHPANRIELSRGRDLLVEPGPASGPINFLAYPVIEIDGKPAKASILFSFKRTFGKRLAAAVASGK